MASVRIGSASLPDALWLPQDPPDVGIALAELEALRELDLVATPEALDGDVLPARLPVPGSAADELRLPPPPVRSIEGPVLHAALGRALGRFEAARGRPTRAEEPALVAEARMMSLLGGIHSLEQEIRAEIHRHRRA